MSLFDLTGKVAIVTGATKGIGLGIATEIAAQGARIIVSSRDQAACDALAEELDRTYGKGQNIAVGIAADLDRIDDMAMLAQKSIAVWGGVDILVCNAAVLPYIGPSNDTPPELFDRLLTRNIHHNFRLCQAVRPSMAKRGGGAIVLIGSEAGHAPSPTVLAYGVAKAGLAHLARNLADEFVGEKIRVNCVEPGLIRSFSSDSTLTDETVRGAMIDKIPLKRIGEPRDIAGAVIYLASEAGSYVTGNLLVVDGGRCFLNPPQEGPGLASVSGTTYN